jgi:anti-sigma-K factor RskA
MSEFATTDKRPRTRTRIWLLLAIAVAAVLTANVRLIYVATMSQPPCVAHLRQGEGDAARGLFSAAQSSCSSPVSGRGH